MGVKVTIHAVYMGWDNLAHSKTLFPDHILTVTFGGVAWREEGTG